MTQTVKTTAQGFDEIRQALSSASAIGAVGGIKIGRTTADRMTLRQRQEAGLGAKPFNAAVTISLDNHYYAKFLGRDMDYLHIPISGRFVMNEVRNVVLDIFAESFAKQASPRGEKWEQITDGTKRWRKWHNYDPEGPILVASGNLAMAVANWPRDKHENYSVTGANSRLVIDISELQDTTTLPGHASIQELAYIHNIGGPWGKGGSEIVARPFMTSDTTDLDAGGRKRMKDAAKRGWKNYLEGLEYPERVKLRPR